MCNSLDSGNSSLVADIAICGIWQRQAMALCDVHVLDTDSKSYLHRPPQSLIANSRKREEEEFHGL